MLNYKFIFGSGTVNIRTKCYILIVMGLSDFKIILEKPNAFYRAGETICGQLLIDLSKSKEFRNITIELVGEGKVHWTESQGQSSTSYKNLKTYINKVAVAHSGPSLPAGIHYLPFSFLLPANLPSSFESDIGSVQYFINATIERDWKFGQRAGRGPLTFKVHGVLDLNDYPAAKHIGKL